MALKADRKHLDSDINFFMNQTAERGGIVCMSTAGSGAATDQAVAVVSYKAATSGTAPLGVLMCDVVNLDLTRQHKNFHKEEVQYGGKVTVWTKGEVVTNMIVSGVTPTVGQVAYLGPDGRITTTNTGAIASPVVGRFLSTKSEDGYCRVAVNLPQQ